MRVAVTGATGFVGRRLLDRLERSGHEPLALVRDAGRARGLLGERYEIRAAGPLDEVAMAGALEGADAVVNLAGENLFARRWTPAFKRALSDSRVLTTRALVRALRRLTVPPRVLVSASAVGIYGAREPWEVVDETTPDADRFAPRGFLANLCQAWEHEALDAERQGLRVVRLRIGVVLGPGGGVLDALEGPWRLGLGGRIGGGRQGLSWIHVDDLLALVLFTLEREDVHGAVNAVAPGAVDNRAFTQALARALGRPALLPVPAPVLRVLLGEAATALTTGQRVAPARALALGFAFRYPTIEAALQGIYGAA